MIKCRQRKKILVTLLLLIVISTIIIFSQLISIKQIDGISMSPTVVDKQVVLISKYNKNIKRNDIILFYYNGMKLIKRAIAIGGDIVKINNGDIFVNDIKIIDAPSSINDIEIKLLEDDCYVVGDNYSNSFDSRNFGKIKTSDIIGVMITTCKDKI